MTASSSRCRPIRRRRRIRCPERIPAAYHPGDSIVAGRVCVRPFRTPAPPRPALAAGVPGHLHVRVRRGGGDRGQHRLGRRHGRALAARVAAGLAGGGGGDVRVPPVCVVGGVSTRRHGRAPRHGRGPPVAAPLHGALRPGPLQCAAMRVPSTFVLVGLLVLATPHVARARIVYECLRDNRLSLATVPEPGSRCKPKQVYANRRLPNYWGSLGPIRGPMYQRRTGGPPAYSTRALPGWTEVRSVVALGVPADLPAHFGLGQIGAPRLDAYAAQFRAAAKRSGVED